MIARFVIHMDDLRMCSRHFRLSAILITAVIASAGCGDGRIQTVPVSGKVFVNGNPAGGARVVLHPIDGSEQFKKERPCCLNTNDDGTFELTTFEKGDGAPVGEYRVAIQWRGGGSATEEVDGRRTRNSGADRLGGKYANAEESGLTAEIPPPDGELVFNLTSQ